MIINWLKNETAILNLVIKFISHDFFLEIIFANMKTFRIVPKLARLASYVAV